MKTKPPKRIPAKLYMYNVKYAWDCPYCGVLNTIDYYDDFTPIVTDVVQCFCCGRKRAGRRLFGEWYKFTTKKTKRMDLKQKIFRKRFKEKKNVSDSSVVEGARAKHKQVNGKDSGNRGGKNRRKVR